MQYKDYRLKNDYKKLYSGMKIGFWRFIKYQIASKLLITIFLIPIFKVLFQLLMKSKGLEVLINGVILKFALSPQGLASMLLIFLFSTLIILIEIGGVVIISYEVYNHKEGSSFFGILKFSLKRFTNLLGLGGLLIAVYLLILVPWFDMGFNTSIITTFKIPGFIKTYIENNQVLNIILKISTALLFIMSISWIFSVHIIMLENISAIKAIKKSMYLIKNNMKIFMKHVVGTTLFTLLIGIGILGSIVLALSYSFPLFPQNNDVTNIVVSSILLIIGVVLYLASFLIIPFEIHHFTILYYAINNTKVETPLSNNKNKLSFIDRLLSHKRIITFILIIIFLVASIITKYILEDLENTKYNVSITAHRGSSTEAPENTLAALEVAINNGADYAEIDVQETKDGELILLHDKSLKRTTGLNKNLYETSFDEVKKLDAGSWFSEEFVREKIPTLQEVIDFTRGKIKLNIELKQKGKKRNLVKKVVETITKNELINSCVVTSLDYNMLQEVEKLNSDIKTGYIMYVAIGNLDSINVDFYSIEESNVNENFVLKAHLLNREVHVWTINERDNMTEMIELGVDNIITDNDKGLLDLLEELNN